MESLAYVVTNKYVILAFDGNLSIDTGETSLTLTRIKKAYRTNDCTFMAIIGNLNTMSNIYRYILTLTEINNNLSPLEIMSDIKDLVPKRTEELLHLLKDVLESISLANEEGTSDLDKAIILQKLESNADLINLLGGEAPPENPKKAMNYILIMNYNEKDGINISSAIVAGQYFVEYPPIKKGTIAKNSFMFGLISSIIKDENKIAQTRQKYATKLNDAMFNGNDWEDHITEPRMVDFCKSVLEEALNEVTPFKSKPEVFYYELGDYTRYLVEEPTADLIKVQINQIKDMHDE